MSNDSLDLITQPTEFFRDLVIKMLSKKNLRVSEQTEFYLVNLLSHFMSTDNLYLRDTEGNFREEPLAFMVKEAIEEPTPENRKVLLRHVGDVSLYMAGYFQDRLVTKMVGVDYYIDLGVAAYKTVSSLDGEPYNELSKKFPYFVDVFAEISDETTPKTEKEILRAYDKWMTTGNGRAARFLKTAGILPGNGSANGNDDES